MSIKNYSILTKKYKAALSTIHTVYRLINSTYDMKNLILRLARLTCQTLSARNCTIVILDPANKKVIVKCAIRHNAKCVVSKNSKVFNSLERRGIRKSQACRRGFKLSFPFLFHTF